MNHNGSRSEHQIKYLKDYRPTHWLIPKINLTFFLDPHNTKVESEMLMCRNPDLDSDLEPLILNGERIVLLSIAVNGIHLEEEEYTVTDTLLTIHNPPENEFTLNIQTETSPVDNTALEGLYISNNIFCTQNEPEGFRKITYFIDRPDVMSKYTVTVIADKAKCPVMLANGNLIELKELDNNLHSAKWEDPFTKPCYLFALVAGDLAVVRDNFITRSKREISLEIYIEKGNENFCAFAMESLKSAMKWDEDTFGLEYDLDIFMIAAVEDFNFGAMENKGLNVFNAKLILADPSTASDEAFERIQGVIAHEYFHNWTGNRVTCRDWFQLTLKEGLTVYRDQRFTADMIGEEVKRIKDVIHLREFQFPEDAGPLSHPIQPESYLEINNFYTMTVYEKGAEVIRMIEGLIGKDSFRQGLELYLSVNDGRAVTTEEFVSAMERASGYNLGQFRAWYRFNRTPVLRVYDSYNEKEESYQITLRQSRPGAEIENSNPLLFPVRVGLLDEEGRDMELEINEHEFCEGVDKSGTLTLHFNKDLHVYEFKNVKCRPVLSILRGFSAPVKLELKRSRETLSFQYANDSDLFNRWEAGQTLARELISELLWKVKSELNLELDPVLVRAFENILDSNFEPTFTTLAISLPTLSEIINEQKIAEFEETHKAHEFIEAELGRAVRDRFFEIRNRLHEKSFETREQEISARKLKNKCLAYLMKLGESEIEELCYNQQECSTNMTDELAAMSLLANTNSPYRHKSLSLFYEKWKENSLVMDYWFSVQAHSILPDTLERIKKLREDPLFNIKNPNKVRSLFGVFTHNPLRFNDVSGEGYAFISDCIIKLDPINPGVAAALSKAFIKIEKIDSKRREHAKAALKKILDVSSLSGDVFEVVDKCYNV